MVKTVIQLTGDMLRMHIENDEISVHGFSEKELERLAGALGVKVDRCMSDDGSKTLFTSCEFKGVRFYS